MSESHCLWRRSLVLLGAVIGVCLAGCTSAGISSDPGFGKGARCVNDSKTCIGERTQALNSLMVDKSNKWMNEEPSAEVYSSGVRLFAYKNKKRSLSCRELSAAKREADAAPAVLKGPGGKALSPAQVSRGMMLAFEVSRELNRELRRRCRRRG